MRVLLVGRNAKVLASVTAAGARARDLTIETAASKAAAFALLEQGPFDLIVACEILGDGSGLEVLSQVAVNTPDTLRIFAARPSTLERLKGELGLFGLFRTLSYPINFRKLWAALNLARSCAVETEAPAARQAATAHAANSSQPTPAQPARSSPPAPAHPAPATSPRAKAASQRPPTRIQESEAFKRARAKRNAEQLEANSHISAVDLGLTTQPGLQNGGSRKRRREPAMTTESLAQLARLATTGRPIYPRDALPRKRRTALFVGSGVFAAGTAAVLSFFMLHANNSMGRSSLPIASIDHPIPDRVFPWQPRTQAQPTAPAAPVRNTSPAPAAADLEVDAEAASENFEVEPGHPGPPPPNPPPAPSEPPSQDTPAEALVDE
jgi:DNA-binding NarL/FixJ family response regulator